MSSKKIENIEKKDNEDKIPLFCVFHKLVHKYMYPGQPQRAFMKSIGVSQRNSWYKKYLNENKYFSFTYFEDVASALKWNKDERASWESLWRKDADIYERLNCRGRPRINVENLETVSNRKIQKTAVRVRSYQDLNRFINANSFQGRLVYFIYFVTNGALDEFKPVKKLSLSWWNKFLNTDFHDDEAMNAVIMETIGGRCSLALSRWLTRGRAEEDLLKIFSECRAWIYETPSKRRALK